MAFRQRVRQTIRRLNGSTIDYDLVSYKAALAEINALAASMAGKTASELKSAAESLRQRANGGVALTELVVETFALVREIAFRTVNMRPFDVQVLGALAMFYGKLAEMQTGEGKTLAAVLPAALYAFTGKGAHILTFNDYLARRDAAWMGPIYQFLVLSVGFVQEGMSTTGRRRAYQADITYLTAKEAGFDFLRDSLCYDAQNMVQRLFHCAIIDEADSILIDEARIPLVIAGSVEDVMADSFRMADVARRMELGVDFLYDDYARNVHLTDHGQQMAEKLLACENLYAAENLDIITGLFNALHAEYLLRQDVDYIVRDGKIELVDEFTGRVADKRRWPDGLQAALEAKENIDIQSKGHILNQITLQHFLRLYPKICGMTATAQASEEELKAFYNLDIAVIPPNAPCIRRDEDDVIFQTREAKNRAVVEEITRAAKSGRPVLVGTSSIAESAQLAAACADRGISCRVLNAKHDEREAEIIAEAGKLGAITISTNMAGRGTDIRLGGSDEVEKQHVVELGGLLVIGTNKHETERIDKQLRGRAGRQGDPGESRYFVSLEDDLMAKYRLDELLPEELYDKNENDEINNTIVRREVARVQRICDGQNLEIKKTLYKYSELVDQQRMVLFDRRAEILQQNNAVEFFRDNSPKQFKRLINSLKADKFASLCRMISLYKIDECWATHLAEIADIREGIHLKRLGGRDPFIEFQKLAVAIFDARLEKLDQELIGLFESLDGRVGDIDLEHMGIKAPTATWTYLVNDNPFENQLGLQLIGDMGMQVAAGVFGPLVALQLLFRKKKKTSPHPTARDQRPDG